MIKIEQIIEFEYMNNLMRFATNNKVFSPKRVDKGTISMLSQVQFTQNDKVLDLGCGYGVVGITAAKLIGANNITMCDISEDAISITKYNLGLNQVPEIKVIQSDGLKQIEDRDYTIILSNPPYHTDFAVPKAFIEQGYKKLAIGGKLYMVTKRKEWYKKKLISVFGGAKVIELNGYYVFMSEKIMREDRKYKLRNRCD